MWQIQAYHIYIQFEMNYNPCIYIKFPYYATILTTVSKPNITRKPFNIILISGGLSCICEAIEMQYIQ
jgi:hypothetical protein